MTSALRRRLRKVSTYAGGDCGTCGRDPNNLEWEWGGLEPLDSPEPAECPQCGTPDALGFEFKGQPDEDHRGGGHA
jgi:hypothetical protein